MRFNFLVNAHSSNCTLLQHFSFFRWYDCSTLNDSAYNILEPLHWTIYTSAGVKYLSKCTWKQDMKFTPKISTKRHTHIQCAWKYMQIYVYHLFCYKFSCLLEVQLIYGVSYYRGAWYVATYIYILGQMNYTALFFFQLNTSHTDPHINCVTNVSSQAKLTLLIFQ